MSLIIRSSFKKDLHSIHFLLSEMGYPDLDFEHLTKTWEEITAAPEADVVVAEFDGMIVGFITYSIKPMLSLTGLVMKIDELGVLSKTRGQGIGTKLLNEVKNIALKKKVKCLVLSTNKSRESYQRQFYVKYGFTESNSAWFKFSLC